MVMGVIPPSLPDPPVDAPEKVTLLAFLDWYRDAMVRKLSGMERAEATRRWVGSQTTLLGVVKHLTSVETWWFRSVFLGESDLGPDDRGDHEFVVADDESVEDIVRGYLAACDRARDAVAGASLDERAARPSHAQYTLRWIVVHMIEETARHAGQADILRELTDGATGD
jgi:uncharacterized damage-inducible protein DinB